MASCSWGGCWCIMDAEGGSVNTSNPLQQLVIQTSRKSEDKDKIGSRKWEIKGNVNTASKR